MEKRLYIVFALFSTLMGCKPEITKHTINGSIEGGAAKYIKIVDMAAPGLPTDSIQLDMGGKFTFEKISDQPADYLLYFKNTDYIRVTPLPQETVNITAKHYNLTVSHKITGSVESQLVAEIVKKHAYTAKTIDTLNSFYLKNQMNPKLDSIIERLRFIGDSVFLEEKSFFENFIKEKPGTFASYIALSLKIPPNKNLFTLKNDAAYFNMVDTALYNRFDTIDIVKMLHGYIKQGERKLKLEASKRPNSLIGQKAPEIALPNVYGDTLLLSGLTGKYVLVDFWGSWCRPCRKENPNLRKSYLKYRKKGFEIFQVAIERNKTDWKNTIREDKLYWKYQVSELSYMQSKVAMLYGVKAIPANFFINPQGVVIAQNLFGEALNNKLNDIFNKKTTPQINNAE